MTASPICFTPGIGARCIGKQLGIGVYFELFSLRMSCFGKPVPTPHRVRGRLFPGHAPAVTDRSPSSRVSIAGDRPSRRLAASRRVAAGRCRASLFRSPGHPGLRVRRVLCERAALSGHGPVDRGRYRGRRQRHSYGVQPGPAAAGLGAGLSRRDGRTGEPRHIGQDAVGISFARSRHARHARRREAFLHRPPHGGGLRGCGQWPRTVESAHRRLSRDRRLALRPARRHRRSDRDRDPNDRGDHFSVATAPAAVAQDERGRDRGCRIPAIRNIAPGTSPLGNQGIVAIKKRVVGPGDGAISYLTTCSLFVLMDQRMGASMKYLLGLLICITALCTASRADVLSPQAFTQEFARALAAAVPSRTVTVKRELELTVTNADGGDTTLFLANPYGDYTRDPARLGELVRSFAAALSRP